MRAAADRIVPVSLELGGKSPSIVYPDADEDWVVDGVIAGMRFTRQSQSCTAGSRLFLHADIFDSFLDKLTAKTAGAEARRSAGRGDRHRRHHQREAVHARSAATSRRACSARTRAWCSAACRPRTGRSAKGYFAVPTVFADTSNDWRLAREEIFGPVLVAIPWRDEAEAIRMANDSHYGLAAYVWTHDIGSGLRTAHAIESGWVQVNQGLGQSARPLLRRLQAERHRPGVLAGGDARQLHPAQERDGEPEHAARQLGTAGLVELGVGHRQQFERRADLRTLRDPARPGADMGPLREVDVAAHGERHVAVAGDVGDGQRLADQEGSAGQPAVEDGERGSSPGRDSSPPPPGRR